VFLGRLIGEVYGKAFCRVPKHSVLIPQSAWASLGSESTGVLLEAWVHIDESGVLIHGCGPGDSVHEHMP
jgi:hypothetical protein